MTLAVGATLYSIEQKEENYFMLSLYLLMLVWPQKIIKCLCFFFLGLLWTAPELLDNPSRGPKGTKEGDVYSFSIILHEIFYRMGTFAGRSYMTAKGIDDSYF